MNRIELLHSLDCSSDEELLRHFPSRYESLKITLIDESIKDGQRVVLKGVVSNLRSINAKGTSIIRFVLNSYSSSIRCILYNQSFYLNKLSNGKELLIVAYYSEDRKVYSVSTILDVDSYFATTGIRPIYALPKSVSTSYFTSYVKKLLSYPRPENYMISSVPSRYIEKYQLINEYDAYRCVHLPKNEKDLENGLRVFKYEEALEYSIRALSIRKEIENIKKGNNNYIDHDKINDFVRDLEYRLTKDQLKAVKEIILDMEDEKMMYRLLQGDVGTGKTIVSFVALYANYLRSKQGVLMAPTFELAIQHYENACKIFKDYPISIRLLAGNNLKKKDKDILLDELKNGKIDILISTHSVISESVKFKDLGLSIIDEQQRFGVKQRSLLIDKSNASDLLLMSATPIPRTLSMIINSDIDVSTLNSFPSGKRNVKSQLVTSSSPIIYQAIDKALKVKRQVFIVAPKIDTGSSNAKSAHEIYQEIVARYGTENVQLVHGKIKKEEQAEILRKFLSGEKLILVSTTVIEVGIDVSRACLLIVYSANFFGLSSLHQLRGRIGRDGSFSLALFVYDGSDESAINRLKVLENSSDGLEISYYDMKDRGTGSYSGADQSGKSELRMCNFVSDYKLFECAKADAKEILDNPKSEDNARYLRSLSRDGDIFLG